MASDTATVRRKAWDEAVLLLLYERGSLDGDDLLVAVLEEACDAMVRLREHGLVVREGEE